MFKRFLILLIFSGVIFLLVALTAYAENEENKKILGEDKWTGKMVFSVFEEANSIVVNNNKDLIIKFNDEGNEVWQNEKKIIESEKWVLEKYDEKKDKWNKIGKINDKYWDQIDTNQTSVKKHYNDTIGTIFSLNYDFLEEVNPKISLEANILEEAVYRIKWEIDGIIKNKFDNLIEKNQIIFFDEGEEKKILFDYSDVAINFGKITEVEIKGEPKNYKAILYFNVGRLKVGEFLLDPSFGYTSIGINSLSVENSIAGSIFSITENGIANSISAYVGVTNKAKNMKAAIYKHSDLSLVGSTDEKSIVAGTGWQVFNFSTKPNLKANTEYLLALWSENTAGDGLLYHMTGNNDQGHVFSQAYGVWPSTLGTATHDTQMFSIYCNYTTAQIALTLSDGLINFGFLDAGSSKSTIASEINDTQEIVNTGNTSETFLIKGENTICPWTLANSVDVDQYVYEFCNSGTGSIDPCDNDPTWTMLTTNYQTLATNIGTSASSRFDLQINMPTSSSCLNQQSPVVTVMAEIN